MSITEREDALFNEWEIKRPGLAKDGVANEEAFCNAKLKILYLLKEVNCRRSLEMAVNPK